MSTCRRPVIPARVLPSSVLLSAILATGCGSSSPSAMPPKGMVWKDMKTKQRMAYMKSVVLPKTKEAFVAFDPSFADMDCVTCHGDGVADGTYKMPNPKITPLPNSEQAFMAWLGKDEKAARFTPFMANTLEPMMAELLHETVFDPKTMTGELGCTACHTLVDSEGNPAPTPKLGTP